MMPDIRPCMYMPNGMKSNIHSLTADVHLDGTKLEIKAYKSIDRFIQEGPLVRWRYQVQYFFQ